VGVREGAQKKLLRCESKAPIAWGIPALFTQVNTVEILDDPFFEGCLLFSQHAMSCPSSYLTFPFCSMILMICTVGVVSLAPLMMADTAWDVSISEQQTQMLLGCCCFPSLRGRENFGLSPSAFPLYWSNFFFCRMG
jgi:hypothetical protein